MPTQIADLFCSGRIIARISNYFNLTLLYGDVDVSILLLAYITLIEKALMSSYVPSPRTYGFVRTRICICPSFIAAVGLVLVGVHCR